MRRVVSALPERAAAIPVSKPPPEVDGSERPARGRSDSL
jgi:hypothetical protein